jgi:hypothetical protein
MWEDYPESMKGNGALLRVSMPLTTKTPTAVRMIGGVVELQVVRDGRTVFHKTFGAL